MRRVHPRGQNPKLGPGRRGTWLGGNCGSSRTEAGTKVAKEWADADDAFGRDRRDSEQPEATREREPP
ncbi:hypothetical protein L484_019076 [Morus notabilis]|uniref:Uncharacterized protein n=1 Tax=Morus notabilis TaxID=981085 RepID=W9RZA3_9ROSA|nr:hypothetical protein L484_019076 [Morus notabilis]